MSNHPDPKAPGNVPLYRHCGDCEKAKALYEHSEVYACPWEVCCGFRTPPRCDDCDGDCVGCDDDLSHYTPRLPGKGGAA